MSARATVVRLTITPEMRKSAQKIVDDTYKKLNECTAAEKAAWGVATVVKMKRSAKNTMRLLEKQEMTHTPAYKEAIAIHKNAKKLAFEMEKTLLLALSGILEE